MSSQENELLLTVNVFYNLLLEAMSNKFTPGDGYRGKSDKLTQTHLFYDLNTLIDSTKITLGNFEYYLYNYGGEGATLHGTYKNAASKFKKGKFRPKSSAIYLFNDIKCKNEFDRQIENEYARAYLKAVEFSNRYFNDRKRMLNAELIQKILYLIFLDSSIIESQQFYICSNGTTKTKKELQSTDQIEFEAFLLGILHYLVKTQKLQIDASNALQILSNAQYKTVNFKLIYSEEGTNTPKASEKISINRNANKSQQSTDNFGEAYPEPPDDDDYYPIEIDIHTDIMTALKNNDIAFSRSILFYLLSEAICTIHPKRSKGSVERLFLALLSLTVEENNCTLNIGQSKIYGHHDKFKYLKNLSLASCLDDPSKIDRFSEIIFNNYDNALRQMIEIRKKFFHSESKNDALVVEIIEFIMADKSISDSQVFYINSDSSSLTKSQLKGIEELEFESFLLGVWYYTISQLGTKDSKDENTFDAVFRIDYNYNGKDYTKYRSGNIIFEQSDIYIDLFYLEDS